MISSQVPVRQKLPGEKKTYQVDLKNFLVFGEALENNDFSVEVYEYATTVLAEQDLADAAAFSLQVQKADGTLTSTTWIVEDGMDHVLVMAGRTSVSPVTDMIIPGTKVWDATNKIASVTIGGGENGKDYLMLWKFVTTSRREEWEAMLLQVRQDFTL
jgi:hypothetical protein